MKQRKIIIAIADGVGDRPIKALEGLTLLQLAKAPYLDRIAREGVTGMMDPLFPGIPVGTDMGHLILFGNDPKLYPGRGPIEAAGVGLTLQAGDIAFRCNFAYRDANGIIVDRRAGRIRQGTQEIAQELEGLMVEDVEVHFSPATEHRAVLVLSGPGLSPAVSDTDPKAPNDGVAYKPAQALEDSPSARKTARILNQVLEIAYERFASHPVNLDRQAAGLYPANFIITRGAGMMTDFQPLCQEFGYQAAVVAREDTVLGMGRLSAMTVITDDRLTGNVDTDPELKANLALQALKTHDLVYAHIKAPDVMGHDNQPLGKIQAIEVFDRMVGRILAGLDDQTYIALVADHSTPCEKGEHSGEPVPIAVWGPSIRQDMVSHYDEIDCSRGGLGRLTGREFLFSLLDLANWVKKQGN